MAGTLLWALRRPGRFQGQNISAKISGGALMMMGGLMPAASFLVAYCQKVLPWTAAAFLHVALQPGIEILEFPTT
jgi:hypothetical protein